MGKLGTRIWLILLGLFLALINHHSTAFAAEEKIDILCTTFPIFQITRNVTRGYQGVSVDLLLPPALGCPHDYALTPQDMQKLSNADVLIVNGLGMEEFLGAPVGKTNSKLRIIDSSNGIKNILPYLDIKEHEQSHHEAEHEGEHQEKNAREGEHDCEDGHHHHAGANPHLFASPRMVANLTMNIASELSKIEPAGEGTYFKNAQSYAETMHKLGDDLAALGKHLKNNRIVQPHGIFDYLARDMGLEIVAVMQAHGQEPSASEMMHLVGAIREKRAGAVFTEPQYPEKVGKALSKETGIPVAMLDPVATGPENAPLSYYETVMRLNMKTLESTLGVK